MTVSNNFKISTKSSTQYMSSWMNCDIRLSEQEESECFDRYYESGDLKAVEQIALSHMRYVLFVVKKVCKSNHRMFNDAVSHGTIGLMKAIYKFNPSIGIRFSLFSFLYIKSEVLNFFVQMRGITNIATSKDLRKAYFNLPKMVTDYDLSQEEAEYIAEQLGISVAVVLDMANRLKGDIYIDHVYQDGEIFEIDGGGCPSIVIEQEQYEDNFNINSHLQKLDDRTKDIIQQRWLSDSKATLEELGNKYNVSFERIRQIEAEGLKKLKNIISKENAIPCFH